METSLGAEKPRPTSCPPPPRFLAERPGVEQAVVPDRLATDRVRPAHRPPAPPRRWLGTLLHTGPVLHRHPLLSLVTGAYLVFVAWLTLTPQPIGPDQVRLIRRVLDALHRRGYAESLDYDRLEFLANIALFVPVGVFALLLVGAGAWWLALLAPVALTVGIETAQIGIPGRVPDRRDLIANTMGGILGVFVGLVLTLPATLRRRRRRRRRRRVAR
jgi:VanZ family protein